MVWIPIGGVVLHSNDPTYTVHTGRGEGYDYTSQHNDYLTTILSMVAVVFVDYVTLHWSNTNQPADYLTTVLSVVAMVFVD